MKITKNKNNKKPIVFIVIVAILLIIGLGLAAYFFIIQKPASNDGTVIENYNRNSVDLGPSTNEQQDAGATIKKDALENDGQSTQDSLSVSISAANQNGNALQVRTIIDTLSLNGSCTLNLEGPSNKSVEKSASIQALASNSTCQGFDIPTSELSRGNWKLTITAKIGEKSGSATQSINIE